MAVFKWHERKAGRVMGTGKGKVLGLSLVAITLVFIVFFQGMVRLQLTKIQIEDQLKQSLHLEALQLEVAYKKYLFGYESPYRQ